MLVRNDDPIRSDAVVVLSGDAHGERLQSGIRAFETTGSMRLVVFVSGHNAIYADEADLVRYAEATGVAADAIRTLPAGSSTGEEAGTIASLAERCGWSIVTIVTSPYHARRAGWTVERAAPNVAVRVVSTDEPYHPGTWFASADDTGHVMLEWLKWLGSVRYLVLAPSADDPGIRC